MRTNSIIKRLIGLTTLSICFLISCDKSSLTNIKLPSDQIIITDEIKMLDRSKTILDEDDARKVSDILIANNSIKTRSSHSVISSISAVNGEDGKPLLFIIITLTTKDILLYRPGRHMYLSWPFQTMVI